MTTCGTKDPELDPELRRFWQIVFSVAASVLVCCLLVIVALPLVAASAKWIYWLAFGSAMLGGLAAIQLRSQDREETTVEGARLARTSGQKSRDVLDDMDGFDD